ncbi:ribonucleoside-diphosphate reductase subunit alpha [bacterium]|nr:ribonucleoside-diphosphate reductase subunit alpha [bacterium]
MLNRSGRPTRVSRVRTYHVPGQRLLWTSSKRAVGVTTEHDMLTRDGTFKSMSEICPSDEVHFPQPQDVQDYAHMDELFFQLLGYAIHTVVENRNNDMTTMTFHDFRQFVHRAHQVDVVEQEDEDKVILSSLLLADLPLAWIQNGCKGAFPTSLLHLPVDKLDWLVTYTPPVVWSFHPLARRTIEYRRTPPREWMPVRDLHLRHASAGQDRKEVLVFDLQVETNDPTYLTELGVAHNGGGKRNGAFAMYLEPWHADVLAFLHAKRSTGAEEERARDLFYGLWIPDLFMKRVEADATWSLMCPSQSPGLHTLHGAAFEEQYLRYEREGKFVRQMPARELWVEMVRMQVETGTPYMLFKDSCNAKSNQQNLGTIRSSNLCTEIIEYSDHEEYAVCNLASIALPKCLVPNTRWEDDDVQEAVVVMFPRDTFLETRWLQQWIAEERPSWTVHFLAEPDARRFMAQQTTTTSDETASCATWIRCGGDVTTWQPVGAPVAFARRFLCPVFDMDQLHETTQHVVKNLNQVIDKNVYPVPETERSNRKHRPVGIGVQGLADVFAACRLPFDDPKARELHRHIFETIYHAAMTASVDLAVRDGPYASFAGSPLSQGRFHFDLCPDFDLPLRWDWETLRARVQTHGARNSLLVAPMPTASTSQILGNNECFEPYTANLYLRRTLSGEFYVVNRFLRDDLRRMGRWNRETVDRLLLDKGSVQTWADLSADLRQVYRTVWEISPKSVLDMAHERHFFIDQSQSLNIFLASTSLEKLSKMHFYAWKKGLKTGCYYVRVKPIVSSPHVTVNADTTCTSCSA